MNIPNDVDLQGYDKQFTSAEELAQYIMALDNTSPGFRYLRKQIKRSMLIRITPMQESSWGGMAIRMIEKYRDLPTTALVLFGYETTFLEAASIMVERGESVNPGCVWEQVMLGGLYGGAA